MSGRWTKVGIVAGGGSLPTNLVEACRSTNTPFHVIGLAGYADEQLLRDGADECGIAEVGKLLKILKRQDCDAVVMAGNVRRPNFATLRPDWKGARLLPKAVMAARRGDGALLDVLVETFEREGLTVVGADEIAAPLKAPAGPLGKHTPSKDHFSDIQKAAAIVAALGPFDVGQGAVVRNGFVLAIEAAEGTDAMLQRVASLPAEILGHEPGQAPGKRGVLVKCPKPGQELRVDLPTIGRQTVEKAAAAGLAGVVVQAGAALVLDRPTVASLADELGLFVYGAGGAELAGEA